MTVRFVTTMFFANALVAMCLIWAMNTWNPAFLWYPIATGSTYAWVCYFLAIRAVRREKQQAVINKRIDTIRQELATRRARNTRNQPIY